MTKGTLSEPSTSCSTSVHSSESSNTTKDEADDDDDNNAIVIASEDARKLPCFESVSVVNSNDVHFGNKTVYQGPVTVKQFVYSNGEVITDRAGTLANLINGFDNAGYIKDPNCSKNGIEKGFSNIKDGKGPTQEVRKNKDDDKIDKNCSQDRLKGLKWIKKLLRKTFIQIIVFIALLILSMSAVSFLLLWKPTQFTEIIQGGAEHNGDSQHNHGDTSEAENSVPSNYTSDSKDTINGRLRLLRRVQWLARPPLRPAKPLTTPVALVIIKQTATESCLAESQCIYHIRRLQAFHIESNGYSDIGFNFLVGGDGAAYECRGWQSQGRHTLGCDNKSISIGFIGTFGNQRPPLNQIAAFKKLVAKGVDQGYIRKDYRLVVERQIQELDNAGGVFYKEIETWENFYNATAEEVCINRNSTSNDTLMIVKRMQWLAQPPTQPATPLKLPVPLVIIQHTATDSCSTEFDCIFHVRRIQGFHIESNDWWDIGYNFLVGGDGSVYEGRGWTSEGAHTFGYNYLSIGVGFIGTFTADKPPFTQINAFKKLVQNGVDNGYIEKNYKLLAARQLQGTESPGLVFYKEIQTWPHWSKTP